MDGRWMARRMEPRKVAGRKYAWPHCRFRGLEVGRSSDQYLSIGTSGFGAAGDSAGSIASTKQELSQPEMPFRRPAEPRIWEC